MTLRQAERQATAAQRARAQVFRVQHGLFGARDGVEPGQVLALLKEGGLVYAESGAALAWPLLESACRILAEMASFASAGVSDRAG